MPRIAIIASSAFGADLSHSDRGARRLVYVDPPTCALICVTLSFFGPIGKISGRDCIPQFAMDMSRWRYGKVATSLIESAIIMIPCFRISHNGIAAVVGPVFWRPGLDALSYLS